MQIDGIKKEYGDPEPWKKISRAIGRTKPQRDRETHHKKSKKSDGRPPDTSRQLLGKPKKTGDSSNTSTTAKSGHLPSYKWNRNSCWLDTALQLIYGVIKRDYYPSFQPLFANLSQEDRLWALVQAMDLWYNIDNGSDRDIRDSVALLSTQRDGFRKLLKSQRIVAEPYESNSLFVGT